MRHICSIFLAAFAVSISARAQTQTPPPPPQTARQALIEMFMGKNPDSFAKHLPESARQTLIRKGGTPETSWVQRISMIGRQMTAQREHLETFDEGQTLLVSEQDGADKERIEVIVEHDNLMGENDEIELSIHIYRNGEPEFLPVIPRLIFSMTQEKEIWRLAEATFAAHVPLTDPEYLQGVRKKENEANENMASARVSMIASAELSYSSKYPDRGYTCTLSDLFSQGDIATAPAQSPEDYTPFPVANDSSGYRFSISGCDGTPASKFQITAVPLESDSGMKAFCIDESGTLRFDANGKGASCLSRGQVVNPAVGQTVEGISQ
jgi:type IV pilus assembly protein PilA